MPNTEGFKEHGNHVVVSAHAYPSTGAAYGAGDLVGTKMSFTDILVNDMGGAAIKSVQVVDKGKQVKALDLILFNENLASNTGAGTIWATGDNTALVVADSDLLNAVALVSVGTGDYSAFSANAIAVVTTDLPIYIRSGRGLYGLLVARGTPTYTSTDDLVVSLGVALDSN